MANNKTPEQIKEEMLHPKQFVFPVRWWRRIETLTEEEQMKMLHIILNYIFNHEAPCIQFGDAGNVWVEIAKEITDKQRRALRSAQRTTEKEKVKEQEESLSALSIEEKELKKEKDTTTAQVFNGDLIRKYPNVAKMRVPLSYEEYMKLLKHYPSSLIKHVLSCMNKWKGLQNNLSAYKTCQNWLQRDKKDIIEQGRWDIYEKEMEEQLEFLERQASVERESSVE